MWTLYRLCPDDLVSGRLPGRGGRRGRGRGGRGVGRGRLGPAQIRGQEVLLAWTQTHGVMAQRNNVKCPLSQQYVTLPLLVPLANDKILWGCDKRMTHWLWHFNDILVHILTKWYKWCQDAASPCSGLVTSWLDCLGRGAEQWVWRYRRRPAAASSAARNTNTEMVTPGAGHRRSWEVMMRGHERSWWEVMMRDHDERSLL